MNDKDKPPLSERWAHLRFSVVGALLADPPRKGELRQALQKLAERRWLHPHTGRPTLFRFSTIERWFYTARRATRDPVTALKRRVRSDSGQHKALNQPLRDALWAQYREHPSWSYQLHFDNLVELAGADSTLGDVPSYASVRRYMKAHRMIRRRRVSSRLTPGQKQATARLEECEVRSYEAGYVNGLWHADFHHGSLAVLTPAGEWVRPIVLGVVDDRSRLTCHIQWYLSESAETLVHGLSQAFQRRALPRALMTDNGSAMKADETQQGLRRLGVVHEPTLPYSPYQNGKQESFWAQLEGRLMAMLEGVRELTLELLNRATQAWCDLEYNAKQHSEIGTSPVKRYLAGPDVGRPSPDSKSLRLAFCKQESRSHRRSDGTVSIEGRRFEVPGRFRHLERVCLRYARWDLSHVFIVDSHTGNVLDRLYPQDKARNADGRRRSLTPESACSVQGPGSGEAAPLLKRLLAEHAATGLPPAYIPLDQFNKDETEDK
jgi:transposase InsO family protein